MYTVRINGYTSGTWLLRGN